MEKQIKKEGINGITLIALVITIIILLILAGVTVAALSGENGLLNQATKSVQESKKAGAKERIEVEILGSYEISRKINMDMFRKNMENNIPEATITGESFPLTVTLDGYSFIVNENGKVELARNMPQITNLKVTQEDGEEIPEEGADEGAKLKIEFSANIKDGTVKKVEPGKLTNGKVSYTSTGIEKEVIFTITVEVGNDEYSTEYTVSLKEYYKKEQVGAADVTKNAKTYYGAEVRGYETGNGVDKWRIFYADDTNIYLISDNYVSYDNVKDIKRGTNELYKNSLSDYGVSLKDIYKDYEGSSWILENSLAKKWLNKYFNYQAEDGTYPNKENTNTNIRAVAYLMDTEIWSKKYATDKNLAEYAIGGPPLEMFVESYNQTHENSKFCCDVKGTVGYSISTSPQLSFDDCHEIYVSLSEKNRTGVYGIWIVAPKSFGPDFVVVTGQTKDYGYIPVNSDKVRI